MATQLRMLLLESQGDEALARVVARDLGWELRFDIADEVVMLGNAFDGVDWQMSAFEPDPAIGRAREVLLDELLDLEAAQVGGETYTVSDVVRACAHRFGGAHYGPAKKPRERALIEAGDEAYRLLNLTMTSGLVVDLAHAVLPELWRLRERAVTATS